MFNHINREHSLFCRYFTLYVYNKLIFSTTHRRKVVFERCGFATFTLPWRNVVTTESETNKPCKACVKLPNKRVHILNVTP